MRVCASRTVEGEGLGEGEDGDVPAVVVDVGVHKGQVAAVVHDGLDLHHVGVDGFVVDGAQQHSPAVEEAVPPRAEDVHVRLSGQAATFLHRARLPRLLWEAVGGRHDPAVGDDGAPALVDAIVLEADLPRPAALPGVHAGDYTVRREAAPAAVWGESGGGGGSHSGGHFRTQQRQRQAE